MGAVAALLVVAGIIGLIYGIMMRMRASRVTDAPLVKTGEAASRGAAVANPKGALSVEGNVSCPQPLVAPMSGKTCLFYDIKVTAEWKEGDTHKTKELSHEKRAAQFAVDDGSGPVWVDAREGGDFEPEEEKDESKSTGLIGGITGQDLVFGQFRVSTGMLSLGTKYRVHEKILPAVPKVYVCGKAGSSNEITAPSWRQLLITGKSRADYLGHAMKTAKIALIAAGSATGLGVILGVVAAVTATPSTTKAATVSTTSVPSAAPEPTTTTAATTTTAPTPTDTAAPANTAAPTKPAAVPAKVAPGSHLVAPVKPGKKK